MNQGIPPRKIVALTFTNKASHELLSRLGLDQDTNPNKPRVSTIHSLALGAIRKNPPAFSIEGEFTLKNKVSPLDDYDQSQMMKKIIERGKITDTNPWRVLENISFHRARGVGFMSDYTEEIAAEAETMHGGYHAMGETELCLWKLYEDEKARNSVVDFEDMLHLTVRRFRRDAEWRESVQRMWDHVLMDEAQDTNQCHPSGTMVRKYLGYVKRKALTIEVPIEQLKDGDLVVAWRRRWGKLTAKGSPIKVSKRWYEGDLIEVTCGGNSVSMTPDHRVYAMLNGDGEDSYVVYLMWRDGYGYRVGQCALRYCQDTKHKSLGGVGARFVEEKADKGWILRVCKTKNESRAWEQILSCKYGIPTTQFEPSNGEQHREFIGTVFANVVGRGEECLTDHELLRAYPLFLRETDGKRKLPSKRYFETRAVNLISGLMSLPSTEPNSQVRIDGIKRIPYAGWVHSLDVQKWHTYVANGLVVKNCQWGFVNFLLGPENKNLYIVGDVSQSIYGFQGAAPELLIEYSKSWRGVQPKLYRIARNHRSGQKIVDMANAIQNKMTRTIPLKMESWRGLNGESGKIEIIRGTFSKDIAADFAAEIYRDNEKFLRDAATVANGGTPRESQAKPIPYRDNCILVRAAIQIRDIEAELVRRRIPYIVRGGKGLLQTEEVRDVLAYMRLATNHRDFMAFVRSAQVPRRGCGDVALEKIRAMANEKHDGDLIVAAEADKNVKIAAFGGVVRLITQFREDPVAMLDRTLALIQYKAYIQDKYRRDKTKVATKLENLQRFAQLIEGMVADGKLTAEDMIFQLTLDRPKDDDESGAVTISTIHSAKGLEWRRVYAANVVEGSLPHKFSMGNEDEIEEERRLWYVAVTRARDYLNICIPVVLQQPDSPNVINLRPSRFLVELGV
jgi:superfamily I DNA/RNA helicase